MKQYSKLLNNIGYKFKDYDFLKVALTHSSFDSRKKNYEKLEFLGDRVLGLIISESIFKEFKDDSEGDLAKKLSFLVRKDTLKQIADVIDLKQYLKISRNLSAKSLDSIKANSLEALIAAIFLDSNFETIQKVVNKLWKDQINSIDLSTYDPKSRLQDWCLKKDSKLPQYKFINKKGPEHSPIFTISVNHNDNLCAVGKGKNKQDAEINAAKLLLEEIEKRKL